MFRYQNRTQMYVTKMTTGTHGWDQVLFLVNGGDVGAVGFFANDLQVSVGRTMFIRWISYWYECEDTSSTMTHWNPVWVLLTNPLSFRLSLLCEFAVAIR